MSYVCWVIIYLLSFLFVFSLYEDDQTQAVKQCEVLLEETNVDSAVRIGDIYAFLAEHHARKQAWKPVCDMYSLLV